MLDLRDRCRPRSISADVEVVYDFCVEFFRKRSAGDETFCCAKVVSREQQLFELIAFIGFYTLISMILNVGEAEIPSGGDPLGWRRCWTCFRRADRSSRRPL